MPTNLVSLPLTSNTEALIALPTKLERMKTTSAWSGFTAGARSAFCIEPGPAQPASASATTTRNARVMRVSSRESAIVAPLFIPETRIGFRFLGSQTWETRVIRVALADLERLIPGRKPREPVVLDAGCGQGKSFRPLTDHFAPKRIELAKDEAARQGLEVDVRRGDLAALELADETVDVIFCHQTFHHLVRQ